MGGRFYRIRIRGSLSTRFDEAFDSMCLEPDRGDTVLSGVCVDASALFGVLDQVRDFGLDLIDVESFAIVPERSQ
ncbi:MAG TPA: hypothetical protein VGH43_11575 [Jatrophihabitans sp.]|jgi:hypothetical protein